jgi:serine/threonine protein kinase
MPAIDVYSFGMCALEMAALEIQGNGDSGTLVTEENIHRTIESLDDEQQKDFIHKCLNKEPAHRPSARELLFHPLLFEVHSLKLLATHALVHSTGKDIILAILQYSIPCHVFLYIKHLSNHTNQMHNIYLLHIFTMFLLHVLVYHTPSSGRTHVPLTQNHLLLHSCYLRLLQ